MKLPEPDRTGSVPVEATLAARCSVREFERAPLTLAEVAQLLWAAQGVTHGKGYRTAPSAGATFPLETYLIAGDVDAMPPGVYRYDYEGHALEYRAGGDLRVRLGDISQDQKWIYDCGAVVVFSAIVARTAAKYRERAVRYVQFEAGHAAQNLMLQAVALGLGTTAIGAFDDDKLKQTLGTAADETPLYMVAVGRARKGA